LIGCHGGVGGYQTQPFLFYPAKLPLNGQPLVGAAAVHHLMKEWLAGSDDAPNRKEKAKAEAEE
jgi:hypothetical protein